jgi:CPA2 family monovalent cation:H+ antiporter-2
VEIPELRRLGANAVIPEEFETSIEIFALVLAHYKVPRDDIDRLVHEIRASHYEALRPGAAVRLSLAGALGAMPQMTVDRIALEPGAAAAGKSLGQLQLRSRTGALVLSIQRGGDDLPTPDPRLPLETGDVLVVVGRPDQVAGARALLRGDGVPPTP